MREVPASFSKPTAATFTSTAITRDLPKTGYKLGVLCGHAAVSIANPSLSIERIATQNGLTFSNGAVYIGHVVNNKRHGSGKVTFPDGKYFDGDWIDDRPHGLGTFHIPPPSESLYIGEVQHGKKHGQGQIWGDAWTYEGSWVEDKMEGRGVMSVMKNKGVETREGDFYRGQLHGKGKITQTNGDVYRGDVSLGQKHGEGVMLFSNGFVYEGDFHEDERHGLGKLTTVNGTVYVGEFQHGVQTGYGTITQMNGFVYTGEVKYGKMHGQGTLQYPNGSVHDGAFKRNMKHGQGMCTYAVKDESLTDDPKPESGTERVTRFAMFEGEYANNKMHGWGAMYFTNGAVSYGLWRKDNRVKPLRKWITLCGGLEYDFAALKAKMKRVEEEEEESAT